MLVKTGLFGVDITNNTETEILEYIYQTLKLPGDSRKLFITTPNPEIIMYALHHKAYLKLLNSSDIALPDGSGVFIAMGLLGNRLKERIPGVDFIEELCRRSHKNPVTMGLIGAGPGVAQLAAECLRKRYPGIQILFARQEWTAELEKSIKIPVDILFVAFGFPKQEEWIHANLERLPVRAAMGVGGAFDYISGTIPRAPFMVRAVGFEWLFRLIVQPWRIKRQLALIGFIGQVIKELVTNTR